MRVALFFLLAIVFAPLLLLFSADPEPRRFSLNSTANLVERNELVEPRYQAFFASSGATREAHSAVIEALPEGGLRAFWYGGSNEGAKDVSIFTAEFDPTRNVWGNERVLVERLEMARQLGIYLKKIGNPVVMRDAQDRLWLFFVTVSVGGWAGSSLNFMISEDNGQNWSAATRLVTSPILNLSTLVKGEGFLYEDGTIGLPVYHEMAGKFGELLHLSKAGEVLDKVRLTAGRSNLQPTLLATSADTARVYLRNGTDAPDSTLFETWSDDGGLSWAPAVLNELPNPNAAVAGLRLADGGLLLVTNNQHDKRNNLSLLYSRGEGQPWRLLHVIEHEENTPDFEYQFSYPAIRQAADGDFHLIYTWNKQRIKHVRFNQAWLAQRLESAQ